MRSTYFGKLLSTVWCSLCAVQWVNQNVLLLADDGSLLKADNGAAGHKTKTNELEGAKTLRRAAGVTAVLCGGSHWLSSCFELLSLIRSFVKVKILSDTG